MSTEESKAQPAIQDSATAGKSKKRARESTQNQTPSKKHKRIEGGGNETEHTPQANGKVKKEKSRIAKSQDVKHETKHTTSNQILLEDDELSKHSPFVQETQSLFVGLSPVAHKFPLEGACAEFISPLLLTYYPPLNGVVLSYTNPRLSQRPEQGIANGTERLKAMGRSIDEYGVTYIWLTADFLVFRPVIGTVLEGYVNLQNESILGLLCYNYFNAGIEQRRLPTDWNWIEDEDHESSASKDRERLQVGGHYVDATGKKVEGRVLFKVKDFEASPGTDGGTGSINIYGTLLRDKHDANLDADLRQQALVATTRNSTRV